MKVKITFLEENCEFGPKNANFDIFLKFFLVKAWKLIFLIIITSKRAVLTPNPAASFLTVKTEDLQKFLYQL